MGITSSRAISLPAIIAGLGGGNAVGTNAVATGATLTNSLSTGTATNPNFVIQVGVATVSGAAQATATTALTIVGETLAATFAGSIGLVSAATLAWNSDLTLARAAAANLRLGAAAVDTGPVAQTISVQGTLAGGTTNVAGANLTIAGSQGKGTGVGGSLIFQIAPAGSTGTVVNALATALTIDSTKLATFTGTLIANDGNAAIPGYAFSGEANTGMWRANTGVLSFLGTGVDLMRVSASSVRWGSGVIAGWTSAAAGSATDTGISRVSAGIFAFGTGAAGSVAAEVRLTTLTASGTIATAAPAGSSAGLWKLGALQTGLTLSANLTQAVYIDIGGVVYKLLTGT